MFWKRRNRKMKLSEKLKKIGIVVAFFNVAAATVFYFSKRFQWFVRNEKREMNELKKGEETIDQFVKDSHSLLKDLFIPNKNNDHRPKALRPRSLLGYAALVLGVKAVITVLLFSAYPSPAQLSAIVAERMVQLTNQSRLEAGVDPVILNPQLTAAAYQKGQDMINRDYFAHDTPEGKRPWEWIDRGEYDYIYAGENLAIDFTSAEMAQDAFMKSPSHRRNIVNPKYSDVGISVHHGEFDGRETILVVVFFGAPRVASAAVAVNPPTAQPQTAPVVTQTPTVNAPAPEVKPTPTPIPEPQPEPTVTDPTPVVTQEPVAIEPTAVAEPIPGSPEALAAGVSYEPAIVVAVNDTSRTFIDFVVEYSNIFFIAFLIFITVALLLNIFIRIRVQHASIILQSVALLALLASLALFNLHFVDQTTQHILIL